jgi:hypothetical protein
MALPQGETPRQIVEDRLGPRRPAQPFGGLIADGQDLGFDFGRNALRGLFAGAGLAQCYLVQRLQIPVRNALQADVPLADPTFRTV